MLLGLQRIVGSHATLLCGATALVFGLLAAKVSSMQSPEKPAVVDADPFKLKNPNAFDPARRRAVRAMKEPRQSARTMALGIDAAEHAARAGMAHATAESQVLDEALTE